MRAKTFFLFTLIIASLGSEAFAGPGQGARGGLAIWTGPDTFSWLSEITGKDLCTQYIESGAGAEQIGELMGAAMGQTCGALAACLSGNRTEDGASLCPDASPTGSYGLFILIDDAGNYLAALRQPQSICAVLNFDIQAIGESYGSNLAQICQAHLDCLLPSPTPTSTPTATPTAAPPTASPVPPTSSPVPTPAGTPSSVGGGVQPPNAETPRAAGAEDALRNALRAAKKAFDLVKKGKAFQKEKKVLEEALSQLSGAESAIQARIASAGLTVQTIRKAISGLRASISSKSYRKDRRKAVNAYNQAVKTLKKVLNLLAPGASSPTPPPGGTNIPVPTASVPSSPPSTTPTTGTGNVQTVRALWQNPVDGSAPAYQNPVDCLVTFTRTGAAYGAKMRCSFQAALTERNDPPFSIPDGSIEITLDGLVNGTHLYWGRETVAAGARMVEFDVCHGQATCSEAAALLNAIGGNNAVLLECPELPDSMYRGRL